MIFPKPDDVQEQKTQWMLTLMCRSFGERSSRMLWGSCKGWDAGSTVNYFLSSVSPGLQNLTRNTAWDTRTRRYICILYSNLLGMFLMVGFGYCFFFAIFVHKKSSEFGYLMEVKFESCSLLICICVYWLPMG